MTTKIDLRTEELQKICKKFNVKELYLFGSATTDNFSEDSDLDFIVKFDRQWFEREFEIIGEVLHRLSRIEEATLAKKIPEYRKIIDFRNIIAHGYDIIDEAAMWDSAFNQVTELSDKVEDY